MKITLEQLHAFSFVLFAIAGIFYYVGWGGVTALIIVGAIFEATAWVMWFLKNEDEQPQVIDE